MLEECMYIELKNSGDNGPAWIGRAKTSKTGRTVYFNGRALQQYHGCGANHRDVESGELFWISGLKKNGCDRHWAGGGRVFIDRRAVDEYLAFTGMRALEPSRYEIVELADDFPVERIAARMNAALDRRDKRL